MGRDRGEYFARPDQDRIQGSNILLASARDLASPILRRRFARTDVPAACTIIAGVHVEATVIATATTTRTIGRRTVPGRTDLPCLISRGYLSIKRASSCPNCRPIPFPALDGSEY